MKTNSWRRLVAVLCFASTAPALASEPVGVSVVSPQPLGKGESLRLSGTVVAPQRANLSVSIDGLVIKRDVDIGHRVSENEILLELDSSLAASDLAEAGALLSEAKANRDEARRQLNEAQRLRANSHVSENEVLSRKAVLAVSEAQVAAAQARLQAAREMMRRHTLKAPFAGVINSRNSDVGEWLSRGDSVLELVGLEQLYVDVSVPQERFGQIDDDAAIEVCTDHQPVRCVPGHLQTRVPVASPVARAFPVRIRVDDTSLGLLTGASATVVLPVSNGETRTVQLPEDVLVRHPDGGYSVFVVHEGKAMRRPVQVLRTRNGQVEISRGLKPDDRVVLRGKAVLNDNQRVRVEH